MTTEPEMAAYDKHGREIMVGDVLKVYHFTAALRRKRYFVYKHVTSVRQWDSGFRCLFLSHLTLKPDDGFYLAQDGKVHSDYEIVQSVEADFEDRTQVALRVHATLDDRGGAL